MKRHGYARHGENKHPLYIVWTNMKDRCYNPNSPKYCHYGGRGIRVCDEWEKNPVAFIIWAEKNGWEKGLYFDRINVNGHYSPTNCRFVNSQINVLNTQLLRTDNTSGYRGVSWHKRRNSWFSQININKKHKHLGYFNSPKLAAIRYDVEVFLSGDSRPTNFM